MNTVSKFSEAPGSTDELTLSTANWSWAARTPAMELMFTKDRGRAHNFIRLPRGGKGADSRQAAFLWDMDLADPKQSTSLITADEEDTRSKDLAFTLNGQTASRGTSWILQCDIMSLTGKGDSHIFPLNSKTCTVSLDHEGDFLRVEFANDGDVLVERSARSAFRPTGYLSSITFVPIGWEGKGGAPSITNHIVSHPGTQRGAIPEGSVLGGGALLQWEPLTPDMLDFMNGRGIKLETEGLVLDPNRFMILYAKQIAERKTALLEFGESSDDEDESSDDEDGTYMREVDGGRAS